MSAEEGLPCLSHQVRITGAGVAGIVPETVRFRDQAALLRSQNGENSRKLDYERLSILSTYFPCYNGGIAKALCLRKYSALLH